MSGIGAIGGSPVSRARPTAEPKAELTPASFEVSPAEPTAELFRDEFVGGPSRSGGARSPVAEALSAPGAQQQGGGSTNSVVDSIRDFIRGLFGGGNGGTTNGGGPVAQSPGKDQLAHGNGAGGTVA